MPRPLVLSRRLGPLMAVQAGGALNDNLFKNAMAILVLFGDAGGTAAGPALVAAAGGVFILPYVLFSSLAGELADRSEMAASIRRVKWAELALMGLAAIALLTGSLPAMFAVLFGLGVQATFFSPLKYGVLPVHLAEAELTTGNGWVEAGTFVAILGGTLLGTALAGLSSGAAWVAGLGLVFAAAGLAASYAVPRAGPSAPGLPIERRLWRGTVKLCRRARANRPVWRCILAVSWFWTIGAVVVAQLPTLVRVALGGGGAVVSLLLVVFSVGVGIGSIGGPALLRGRLTPAPVPWAGLGIALAGGDLAWTAAHAGPLPVMAAVLSSGAGLHLLADLAWLGVAGGVFSVPLYALIQALSAPGERARMIAANNVVNAVGIVLASGLTAGLAAAGIGPAGILALFATLTLPVALWAFRLASGLRTLQARIA